MFNPNRAVGPLLPGLLVGIGAAFVGMDYGPFGVSVSIWCFALALLVSLPNWNAGILRFGLVDVLFLLVIGAQLSVEVYNSTELHFRPSMSAVTPALQGYCLYIVARVSVASLNDLHRFSRALCYPAFPMAAVGVLQVLDFDPVVALTSGLAGDYGVVNRLQNGISPRAWGLTGHWTGFGGYLAIVLVLWLVADLSRDRKVARKNPWPGAVLLLAGIFSTLTWSMIAVAMVCLLVYSRFSGLGPASRASILIAGSALALVVPGMAGRLDSQFGDVGSRAEMGTWVPDTIAYRFRIWSMETVPAIGARSTTGWGSEVYSPNAAYGSRPGELLWPSSESQWLDLAVRFGVPVALLFLGLVLAVLSVVLRSRSLLPGGGVTVVLFCVLSLMVASLTAPVFTNRGLLQVFWPMVGMLVGLREAGRGSFDQFVEFGSGARESGSELAGRSVQGLDMMDGLAGGALGS